ncbi:hypothetical protein ACFLR8_02710 [Bacteroidota bacterium]
MKIFISHIALIIFLLPLAAQEPGRPIDLYIGGELNMANNIQVPEIFGHDKSGYYAYSFDYRPAVEYLDNQFRSRLRKYLDLTRGFRSRNLVGLYHFHDSIYMFTTEQRMKRMLLFVETIDKKTLEQNGDERLLMNVENLSGWISDFGFQLSRQETKLLVFSRIDVLSKNIQDIHFELYGEGFSLEWEADQRIIYPDRPPRESIIKINEQGNVFFISLLDDQKLQSLWSNIKNRYHLIAITEKGKFSNNYLLDLPGLYIRGVQIEPASDNILSCAGFYSPTHFRGMVDGMFYFELDNEIGRFRTQRIFEFESWFLTESIARAPRKEPEEMFDFRVRQLIRRNNGDFIMLAENEFDQDYDTYQNIIVASFSPGGNLNWKRVIPKRQGIDNITNFNYSSYSVHAPWNTDEINLLFNDDYRNGDWPQEKTIKSFHPNGKANLKVIGVGPSGEISSNIIYRKTKKKMKTPIPLQYYDMLNNELVIPALRLKRYNYFKISFNE